MNMKWKNILAVTRWILALALITASVCRLFVKGESNDEQVLTFYVVFILITVASQLVLPRGTHFVTRVGAACIGNGSVGILPDLFGGLPVAFTVEEVRSLRLNSGILLAIGIPLVAAVATWGSKRVARSLPVFANIQGPILAALYPCLGTMENQRARVEIVLLASRLHPMPRVPGFFARMVVGALPWLAAYVALRMLAFPTLDETTDRWVRILIGASAGAAVSFLAWAGMCIWWLKEDVADAVRKFRKGECPACSQQLCASEEGAGYELVFRSCC